MVNKKWVKQLLFERTRQKQRQDNKFNRKKKKMFRLPSTRSKYGIIYLVLYASNVFISAISFLNWFKSNRNVWLYIGGKYTDTGALILFNEKLFHKPIQSHNINERWEIALQIGIELISGEMPDRFVIYLYKHINEKKKWKKKRFDRKKYFIVEPPQTVICISYITVWP